MQCPFLKGGGFPRDFLIFNCYFRSPEDITGNICEFSFYRRETELQANELFPLYVLFVFRVISDAADFQCLFPERQFSSQQKSLTGRPQYVGTFQRNRDKQDNKRPTYSLSPATDVVKYQGCTMYVASSKLKMILSQIICWFNFYSFDKEIEKKQF